MTLEQLRDQIPEYAKDLKLNLSSAMRQTELTESQPWGGGRGLRPRQPQCRTLFGRTP